jgi:CRP-like cAMP-binding protein
VVDLQYATSTGERRTVDTIEAGDIVGWSAVIEPYMMTAFAVARTACKTIAIDAFRLRQLIKEDVTFADALMAEIAHITASRLRGAREQIARLS